MVEMAEGRLHVAAALFQQAADVAAYITSRPRPDFPGKEHDWPRGDPPPDVAYATLAADSAAAAAAGR